MSGGTQIFATKVTRAVNDFLAHRLSAPAFEILYASLWREGRDSGTFAELSVKTRNGLDRIFTTLDCYCSDQSLRQTGDLNDDELMREVAKIFSDMSETNP